MYLWSRYVPHSHCWVTSRTLSLKGESSRKLSSVGKRSIFLCAPGWNSAFLQDHGRMTSLLQKTRPSFLSVPRSPPPRASVRDCSPSSTCFPFPLLLHHSRQKVVFSENNGVGGHIDVPCVAGHSTDIYSSHFDRLCVCALPAFHCTKKLLRWGQRTTLICGYGDMNLEGSLILCLLRKRITVGVTLGSCEFPASGFLGRCKIGICFCFLGCFVLLFFSCRWDIKSHQKMDY